MKKITPFLWFDGKAEEAVHFYTTVFKDAKIGKVVRHGGNGSSSEASVLTIGFQLFGQDFVALNGGPQFQFTEAISFVVNCENQEEVDQYWEKLSEGGKESMCGWLKDKFGLSWQIVPTILPELISSSDKQKAGRAMQAMMNMKKLDIAALKKAYEGEPAEV